MDNKEMRGTFDPQLLQGKVAVVTGATSGIGRRSAELIALSGAAGLVICARTEADGLRVRDQIRSQSPACRTEFQKLDYTKSADICALFEAVRADFGRLDILVHTVISESVPLPFFATNRAQWVEMVNTLFLSFVECCYHAVPLMKQGGGGSIVSLASDAVKVPTPGEQVAGGCLCANVMFGKVLAIEEGRSGIRVNTVCPSITRGTRNYERVMADPFARELFSSAERKARLGVPDASDLAATIVFLCSPLASHVTGQVISVNGGISIS
jgi:NAD(P)-dependent dehydrogenase (short-subunit alcohol dehydrogenase family)